MCWMSLRTEMQDVAFVGTLLRFSLLSLLLVSLYKANLLGENELQTFNNTFNCWIWQCLFIFKFFFKRFTDGFVKFVSKVTFNNANSHFTGKQHGDFFEHKHVYHLQHLTIVLDWFWGVQYTISVTFHVILNSLSTVFLFFLPCCNHSCRTFERLRVFDYLWERTFSS